MSIDYRHYPFNIAQIVMETAAALRGFVVDASGADASGFVGTYTGHTGTAQRLEVFGTALRYDGDGLRAGRIDQIAFLDAAGRSEGQVRGLELSVSRLTKLLDTPHGLESWLMRQDWSSQTTAGFNPATTLPKGSVLDDGTPVHFSGDDFVALSQQADVFHAGSGNDIVYGLRSNDTLMGATGNDTIKGQQNDDRLYGGTGDDLIFGGSGDDRLAGQQGADRFGYEIDWGDTNRSLGGRDTIVDFTLGEDRIQMELSAIGIAGFDDLTIRASGDHAVVRFTFDSAGETFVQRIKLLDVDHTALTAEDFIFL